MNARIVVLNYNGEKLMRECLPSILQASRKARNPTRVTVIDNRSEDRSLEVLRSDFPQVDLYAAPHNRVLCSYNEFLPKVDEPIVILLNNDIRVDEDFVDPLIEKFETSEDVFMVTPKCLSFDGSYYEGGRSRAGMKWGLFWCSSRFQGYEALVDKPGVAAAAGFGAFDRKKFMELKGYDDLYLPGRLEDNDICFRAWRRGWTSCYEPRSVVYHKGASSFNQKFGRNKTLVLGHRNSFLFVWKNVSDVTLIMGHLLLLLPRLVFSLLTGKPELALALWKALPLLPLALKKRKISLAEPRNESDRKIFDRVNHQDGSKSHG